MESAAKAEATVQGSHLTVDIELGRRDRQAMSLGTVFFVTGSSRGLGRAIVESALAADHRVVATARNPRDLDDLVAKHGDRVLALPLDVTESVEADLAMAAAVRAFGRVDVLVNNAGQADRVALEDTSIEAFRRQVETNFFGTVYLTKAAIPIMREQGGGRILQVSSVGGRVGSPGLSAYQSAKWAVGGLSEALAAEVAPFGIRITVLEPGGMRTDWAGSSMATPPVSSPYEGTVGAAVQATVDFKETAVGDPQKVAEVVVQVAGLEEPPLRLLLGSDAYDIGRSAWLRRIEIDAEWEGLSRSTDWTDGG